MVLAGLNEGCWPQMSGPDPWLSRNDRQFVGLPPAERRIGRSAHDFLALAASAPRVILTRAKKENGSLTRPSRWISRIKALAAGAGKLDTLRPDRPWLDWAAAQRTPERMEPASPPAAPAAARRPPAPPERHRHRDLVRQPLRHLCAPHSGPRSAAPPDETSDARDKGILYHAALNGFFEAYPRELPENAAAKLLHKLG